MGNGIGKIGHCFTGSDRVTRHHRSEFYPPDPGGFGDDSLGHSFCYVRPDPARPDPPPGSSSIFRSISGASVSANTSTNPLSVDPTATATSGSGPLFESSTSFASAPLHPLPKSGPLITGSGPVHDRCFLSGPIDRAGVGFLSGPLDRPGSAFSGPLDRASSRRRAPRKILRGGSHTLVRGLRRALSKTFGQSSFVAPVRGMGPGSDNWIIGSGVDQKSTSMTNDMKKDSIFSNMIGLDDDVMVVDDDDEMMGSGWVSENLQWAQGRAGEDRVHVVVSEDHGWVFVGIYDGFNGPDATDFLLSNLYPYVVKELKGLLWDECSKFDSFSSTSASSITSSLTHSGSIDSRSSSGSLCDIDGYVGSSLCCHESDGFCRYENGGETNGRSRKGRKWRSKHGGVGKKWGENQRKWKCEWDRERLELDRRLKEQWSLNESKPKVINHTDVMKALAQALQKTEEAYLDIADRMLDENPELALMGSCVLVMLMKGEDVYVVNVGDSRAILAQTKEPDLRLGMIDQDLERINEESMFDFHVSDGVKPSLRSVQLTIDHSTSVDEEVQRIRGEHPDDAFAVVNDRVKGSLKVTRAFGAGFLKQPKWNNALLEMFRIDYVGTSPYINCLPSLCHHRLGAKDQFLLLSSDGLYQYFTNEEAVAEVELFISLSPEGDPAQHLVEEVLLRAAKKAGMDFYELLEIPQGERRKYHDDVSIIIISFEGRIWRSCV